MVVCQYYLKGNCKFGDRCWFDHPKSDETPMPRFGPDHYKKYHYENKSNYPQNPASQPFYHFLTRPTRPKNVDFSFNETLSNIDPQKEFEVKYEPSQSTSSSYKEFEPEELNNIKEDMDAWCQGKMWSFTCYSPRNRGNLSCFRDISPEELRWNMIEAQETGTLESYFQNYNETLSKINSRRQKLKHPTLHDLKSWSINENDNFQMNSKSVNDVLAQTTIKLPQNETFLSSVPRPGNNLKFTLPDLSRQPTKFQSTSQNFNQNNVFNTRGLNVNAKSFSFNQTLESERSAFPTPVSSSSFGASETLMNNFSAKSESNFGKGSASNKDNIYTELNVLCKAEKEQYMASIFVLGEIPINPPPIELCF